MDQIAAKELGKQTPLASLELGLEGGQLCGLVRQRRLQLRLLVHHRLAQCFDAAADGAQSAGSL